jgi:hypothetical protein
MFMSAGKRLLAGLIEDAIIDDVLMLLAAFPSSFQKMKYA